jgi:hypothetical protein
MGARNIFIAWLVFMCLMLPGGLLLQGSEAALVGVQVLAFAAFFTLLHWLDDRDRQRRQHGG